MRVVRLQTRNPVVVALVLALLLAVLVLILTVGLAVGAALAAVGGAALLVRRVRGPRLPPADRRTLDPRREVFPSTPDEQGPRLPPGAH